MQPNLFENPDFDPDAYETALGRPAAARSFVILFTPRSGSSWLTDVLTRTGRLGMPQEWFNPNFVPNIARAINARSLDSYLEMLRRKHARGGIFATEITIYQMRRAFGDTSRFRADFPAPTPFFYLTREDMVLQAVSLAKAVRTSVFHSRGSSSEEIVKADDSYTYDGDEIDHWLGHVLDQERKCEAFFGAHGITPIRTTYEEIIELGERGVARYFLQRLRPKLDLDEIDLGDLATGHRKIGSRRNADFAARFRAEFPDRISEIEQFRGSVPARAV